MPSGDCGRDHGSTERRLEGPASLLEWPLAMETPEGDPEACWRRLELDVPGTPKPQGSKRHVGRGILIESCRDLKPWREAITAAAIDAGAVRVTGPVMVQLQFRFDRPKGHYGKRGVRNSAPETKTTKPDIDKLSRAALDSLWPCWNDDSQVVALLATKGWCQDGELPGVRVVVAWEF